ncbi:hypothetical protein [Streptomyces sp. NPDC093808]|uniref:hypothetical protein n=1 Tax=Streptomyces sp. NPDC093808 TaxID=3154985 RepID=UPI003450FD78
MTSQKKPPASDGPDGTGGSSVRRAVSLGPAAADPGPMLAPAARRTAAPEPAEGGAEEAGTAQPAPETPETPNAPGASESEAAPEQPATGEPATTVTASASQERPEAGSESAAGPATTVRAAAADEAAGAGGTAAAAAAGAGGTAAAAAGADGPRFGNPKKPLLAAAGIAGVVLLAVPLLIWATDDSRQKKDDVKTAAGSGTLLAEDSLEVPKGQYAPATPTPAPSTRKPSAKSSPDVKKQSEPPVQTSSAKPQGEQKARKTQKQPAAPKLPPNTAAYAVQQLAASDPGRHICYRVHAAGRGWSDVACDGAVAGTPGSGTLTAANIAVSGTNGTSGGAFTHNPASTDGTGHYADKWTSVADGVDHYVGSTEKGAPHMLGFSISVDLGAGTVCQTSYVHDDTWLGLACDEPGTGYDFTYVGTHDNNLWIEAIRLTV